MSHPAPAKDTDRFFEETETGEVWTIQDARTITEADIANFAGISGDFHPHHVSKTFTEEEANFDERVAHGNLTFTITEGLACELNLKSLSYGHKIRYIKPVKIGDTISVTRTVAKTEDYDDTFGQILYNYETTNQDGETVLVDDHIQLVRKKDGKTKQL